MMTIILTALWLTGTGILSVLTLLCLSFTITDIVNRDGIGALIGSAFTASFAFLTVVSVLLGMGL
jgi:hypothetical protein